MFHKKTPSFSSEFTAKIACLGYYNHFPVLTGQPVSLSGPSPTAVCYMQNGRLTWENMAHRLTNKLFMWWFHSTEFCLLGVVECNLYRNVELPLLFWINNNKKVYFLYFDELNRCRHSAARTEEAVRHCMLWITDANAMRVWGSQSMHRL